MWVCVGVGVGEWLWVGGCEGVGGSIGGWVGGRVCGWEGGCVGVGCVG